MNDTKEAPQPARPCVLDAITVLMDRVKTIAKGDQVPAAAGGYRYRSVEDLLAHIGPAARAANMALQSEWVDASYDTEVVEKKNGDKAVWTSARLVIKYQFTSLEDGSTFSFTAAGEGRDNSDKATSKAMSMALKYALSQAFLIALGEPDPDGERPGAETSPEGAVEDREARPRQTPQDATSRPASDKAGRARQAMAAAQNSPTRDKLIAIASQAKQEDLLDEKIGGSTLGDHLNAIEQTLP